MNDEAAVEKLARVLTTWTIGPPENAWNCADALLPVIREIAAEELREAANGYATAKQLDWAIPCETLRRRADALTKPDVGGCGTCDGSGIAPDHSPQPDDEQPCPECCLTKPPDGPVR